MYFTENEKRAFEMLTCLGRLFFERLRFLNTGARRHRCPGIGEQRILLVFKPPIYNLVEELLQKPAELRAGWNAEREQVPAADRDVGQPVGQATGEYVRTDAANRL